LYKSSVISSLLSHQISLEIGLLLIGLPSELG